MFVREDFEINESKLIVRKSAYSLSSILAVSVRKMMLKDYLLRIFSYGLLFSAVGWIFPIPVEPLDGMPISYPLLLIGIIAALLTSKKYELRAEFRGNDETGNQWSSIARGGSDAEYRLFKEIEKNLSSKIAR